MKEHSFSYYSDLIAFLNKTETLDLIWKEGTQFKIYTTNKAPIYHLEITTT